MSLFVDVAITADSIVKAAWTRATANRERMRRRMDIQAVREGAGQKGGKDDFWETVYTTPTPSLYKPDEPVAYPLQNDQNANIVAVAYGGYRTGWPGIDQGILLWSGNGEVSLSYDLINLPSPSRTPFPTPVVVDVTAARVYDELRLPVNATTLIYCYYGRTFQGSSTWSEPFTADDFVNGAVSMSEESYCAVISKTGARAISMPGTLLGLLQAATPAPTWIPGGVFTDNGGETFYARYGEFSFLNGSPDPYGSRSLSNLRFEEGNGNSAGIYQALGGAAITPPSVALAACKLEGTCSGTQYGFDLTRNPDAETPTYTRNAAADVTIPAGRLAGQLLTAWDWGKPAHCKQRLLGLGFSSADLTP